MNSMMTTKHKSETGNARIKSKEGTTMSLLRLERDLGVSVANDSKWMIKGRFRGIISAYKVWIETYNAVSG